MSLLPFVLGYLSGGTNKNDEINMKTVDIKELEKLVTAAKYEQQSSNYVLTEDFVKDVKPPAGYKVDTDVVELLNEKVLACQMTLDETRSIMLQLKQIKV